jgi:origin recognition complex subunit 3
MKHFEEPLTVFVHDTSLGTERRELAVDILLQPKSFAFLDSVFARLQRPNPIPSVGQLRQWRTQDVPAVLDSIDDARLGLKSRARRMRVAFKLMRTVQQFMRRQGYRSADLVQSFPEMMIAATKGKLGRDGKYIATMVKCVPSTQMRVTVLNGIIDRKVSNPQLSGLLDELHAFFHKMPSQVWQEEDEAVSKIISWMSALPVDHSVSVVQLAKDVGEWLTDYFRYDFPDSVLDGYSSVFLQRPPVAPRGIESVGYMVYRILTFPIRGNSTCALFASSIHCLVAVDQSVYTRFHHIWVVASLRLCRLRPVTYTKR